MALGFQSGAFQTPGFQQNTGVVVVSPTSAGGGTHGHKKKYGDDLSYEDWQKFTEWRDALYAKPGKVPAKTAKAIRKAAQVVDVPPDIWLPPFDGQSAQAVAEGLARMLDYLVRIDALSAKARQAQAEEDEDDEAAAEMLLLH